MSLCVPVSLFGETLCKSVYTDQGRIYHAPPLTSSSCCEPRPDAGSGPNRPNRNSLHKKKNTIKIKMQDETTQKAKQNKANKSIGNICKHEQRRRMRGDEKEWRRLRKEGYCYLQRHSRTYTPSRNLECLGEIHSTSEELNRIHIFTQVSQFIWHQKLLESSMIELEHHCISDTKPKMLICAASTSEDCLI